MALALTSVAQAQFSSGFEAPAYAPGIVTAPTAKSATMLVAAKPNLALFDKAMAMPPSC